MSHLILKPTGNGKYKIYDKNKKSFEGKPMDKTPETERMVEQKDEVEDKKLEKEKTSNPLDCLCRIVSYNAGLQFAHWMADTITNEHKALGDLYDEMVKLVDTFAETYMGKYDVMTFPKDMMIEDVSDKPVAKGLEIITDLQDEIEEDEDLLNIVADMEIALNKAKYFLKEK